MKTSKLMLALLFCSSLMSAQVAINVNIGARPAWGPVGYTEATYYYLPDIETYYDINSANYIYISNGRWIHARTLPVRHRHYDLYAGRKVVLVDHSRPYAHFHQHKVKYRPVVVHERPRYYYADKHYDKHHHKKDKHHKKHKHGRGHDRD